MSKTKMRTPASRRLQGAIRRPLSARLAKSCIQDDSLFAALWKVAFGGAGWPGRFWRLERSICLGQVASLIASSAAHHNASYTRITT